MPRKHVRTTSHASATREEMLLALEEIKNGMSIREVAKRRHINRTTLGRYYKECNRPGSDNGRLSENIGYNRTKVKSLVFPWELESLLAQHIKDLDDRFHGLTRTKCRELAFSLADKNNIQMPSNWVVSKMAGIDWFEGFKERHHLTCRKPEATSLGRATAFNKTTVGEFFDNLGRVMDRYNFAASRIYNLDETGVTTVQRPNHIVTTKGKKQVGSVTSAERGELVTVVCAVSASGVAIPPMFIFPRVRYKEEFVRHGPAESIGEGTKSGWINEEKFLVYLKHFVKHSGCSPSQPVLLILDNHESHVSWEAVEFADKSGIELLTLPPHTSHKLQPLDKSVFGPFKGYYNQAVDGWMRTYNNKTFRIYDIPQCVKEAFLNAMTPRNITSGFASTGIYPFNKSIFTDTDFAPSLLSDRPNPQTSTSHQPEVNEANVMAAVPNTIANRSTDNAYFFEGATHLPVSSLQDLEEYHASESFIPPNEVIPLPSSKTPRVQRKRKRVKSRVLTETPEKQAIKIQHEERRAKQEKLLRRKQKIIRPKPKKPPTKRVLALNESSSSDEDDAVPLDDMSDTASESGSSVNEEQNPKELAVGDFVVVKFNTKENTRHYIGKIDDVGTIDEEPEARFLQKVPSTNKSGKPSFTFKENDEGSFPRSDIVKVLPNPQKAGGTARRESHFIFNCCLKEFNLE